MVSHAQVQAFRDDGFLLYGPLLSEAEAADVGEHLDHLARSGSADLRARRLEGASTVTGLVGEEDPALVAQLISPAEADARVWACANDARIVEIVGRLVESDDLRLLGNQALLKPAHHGSAVSWHQDSGYWGDFVHEIDPPAIVSCWLAVDPVTEENGCVRMVPGSHRAGPRPHRYDEADLMRHVEGADLEAAVPIVLSRGGASFHHSLTVHGSGRNDTPHRRRGLALHYVRADFGWSGPAPRPELPRIIPGLL